MIKLKDITSPVAILGCVAIPAVCTMLYFTVKLLVEHGENFGGIVAAVVTILGALGWSNARTRSQLDKVEKLTNGNLSRVEAQRDAAYQQSLHLAAQSLPGTVVPLIMPPVAEQQGNAGHAP